MKTILNLIALFGILTFVMLFPVIKPSRTAIQPAVKAASVTEPPAPISKNIAPPDISGFGVYILDIATGTVLFEKNPHVRQKPASLTKIMTALIAMDYFDDDAVLTVKNGQNSDGNTVDLQVGDELTAYSLYYALLVSSGNDAAVTFAENYPGGYQAFVGKMNSKSIEVGLLNTHFTNVSGVESADHYTSAHDITILTKSALTRPRFSSVVSTKNVTLKSLKGNQYSFESTNLLLGKPGIYGVKTGWTPEAGECLVTLAEINSHPVIISLLNSQDRFGEAQKLIDWVIQNYSWE